MDRGAVFVDLRRVSAYLDVHVPGSIELLYEFGPGMASRARDCVPLDVPFVLLDLGEADVFNAAASLRGKGFAVLGRIEDGINAWAAARGSPASTETATSAEPPPGSVLHVGDHGSPRPEGAQHIPIEKLWERAGEVDISAPIVVAAGSGVRAALAVGILERAGAEQIIFWKPS